MVSLIAVAACEPDFREDDSTDSLVEYPIPLESLYEPSGWMGDGALYVSFDQHHRGVRRPGDHDRSVMRISYSPGSAGWTALYWQWPEGNWGETQGRSLSAERVTFSARGELGGELVAFNVGGIGRDGELPFRDKVDRSSGGIFLENEWKQYEIDLRDQDLSSLVGGFAWTIQSRGNVVHPVTFYLDNVQFE